MDSTRRAEIAEATGESKQSRQHRSAEEKQRIVAASFASGATVQQVAQEHGVRASQVYQWRKQYGRRPGERKRALAVKLLPVAIAAAVGSKSAATASSVEVMEIELEKGRVRMVGADGELVRAVLEMLR